MGALPEKEAEEVAEAIARHPELHAELTEISAALEAISPVEGHGPGIDLRDRVLASIPADGVATSDTSTDGTISERQGGTPSHGAAGRSNVVPFEAPASGRSSATGGAGRYMLAASFIGVLLCASAAIWFWTQLQTTEDELADTRQARRAVDQLYQEAQEELEVFRNHQNQVVRMKPTSDSIGGMAIVYWNADTKQIFLDASTMPALPEGEQYQLWAIADGDPVDAGVFDGARDSLQALKTVNKVKVFAVTVEPKGGSPTPTLDKMTVMGEIEL